MTAPRGATTQIRVHGRGGQGVVTLAELISVAAFLDGHEAQAFPSFGPERTGAPLVAYCRISDRPIRVREPVSRPDAVIVCDPGLLHHVPVLDGLTDGGWVLVNSSLPAAALRVDDLRAAAGAPAPAERTVVLGAADIARRYTGRPLANTCLLGAFAAMTGLISIDAVGAALRRRFPGAVGEQNAAAARAGWALVAGADAAAGPDVPVEVAGA